jgi:hypothetical protein
MGYIHGRLERPRNHTTGLRPTQKTRTRIYMLRAPANVRSVVYDSPTILNACPQIKSAASYPERVDLISSSPRNAGSPPELRNPEY